MPLSKRSTTFSAVRVYVAPGCSLELNNVLLGTRKTVTALTVEITFNATALRSPARCYRSGNKMTRLIESPIFPAHTYFKGPASPRNRPLTSSRLPRFWKRRQQAQFVSRGDWRIISAITAEQSKRNRLLAIAFEADREQAVETCNCGIAKSYVLGSAFFFFR